MTRDQVDRARTVPIEQELERRGVRLKGRGRERSGPCPNCGGTDRFSINSVKGVWNCRGFGGGDVIDFVRHLDGCDFSTAVAVLVGEPVPNNSDRERQLAQQREQAERDRKQRDQQQHQDEMRQRDKARWLWSQRKPITAGTPPWIYLQKRGYSGPIPASLDYLPASDNHPSAMIAAFGLVQETEPGVIAAPVDVRGVHLTKLTADGDKIAELDGAKAKIMLGASMGYPIVLAPSNDLLGMAVTEGIEDGLSVYAATGLGVWVAGAANRMPALGVVMPNYVEICTIYAHADDAGQRGALELARALEKRGIEAPIEGLG
jgi:putative DNA primase/helicase